MNLFESIKTGSLIGKYLTGKETEAELVQLRSWIKESAENQKKFLSIKNEKSIASEIEVYEKHDKDIAWKNYMDRIAMMSIRKVLIWWKVAAVFFFLVGCGGVIAFMTQRTGTTLEANEAYTTVSTINGQNSKIILPDSSVVWINSGTTLSYNSNFAAKQRDIRLIGQAFFQVARNEKMPLTVTCNDLKVKVLGTRFDVCAYPNDNQISVILESGKVELLRDNIKSFGYTMISGEMAKFNISRKELSISKVNSNRLTSWKDGILYFKNDQMGDVFSKLERWYNITIEVKDPEVNKLIFNATIVNESVEEIFELIRFTCGVNYKIIPSKDPAVPVKVVVSARL